MHLNQIILLTRELQRVGRQRGKWRGAKNGRVLFTKSAWRKIFTRYSFPPLSAHLTRLKRLRRSMQKLLRKVLAKAQKKRVSNESTAVHKSMASQE
jgi:hypothetical protein